MLLDTVNAMIQSAESALQTTCGLTAASQHVSLVREGNLTFPALAELSIRNGPLQKVHLGCDNLMAGQLAGLVTDGGDRSGVEELAERFSSELAERLEGRNPRVKVEKLDVGPITIHSRGVRTFGFRFETGAGQLFLLADIPSLCEMEIAKGSEFMPGMISTYLPQDWRNRQDLGSSRAVDNFLVLVRKAEGDVYFELPTTDEFSVFRVGLLVKLEKFDGQTAIKFCTDLTGPQGRILEPGDKIRANAGVDNRSLEFETTYLGTGQIPLTGEAELPAAYFSIPEEVAIVQRRRAFRIPVLHDIKVEIRCGKGISEPSPWSDDTSVNPTMEGKLADLSFSGARIVVESGRDNVELDTGHRVLCNFHFPEEEQSVQALAIIRRSTSGLSGRNDLHEEIGVEFMVTEDMDRTALEYIRQYVLAMQRSRLAQRISV